MQLSVVIITHNEEANIGRTLASVKPFVFDMRGATGRREIIVVDSDSTDRTVEIANSLGATVYVEEWKGYAAQKNWAINKATGQWILSLDADEEVSGALASEDRPTNCERKTGFAGNNLLQSAVFVDGFSMPRKNMFLHRWIKHGGFWPDNKIRLFRRATGRFTVRPVHEERSS